MGGLDTLTTSTPFHDAILVFFGNFKLSDDAIHGLEVVKEVRVEGSLDFGEVIGEPLFVGVNEDDAGGEALIPSEFRHELEKIGRGRACEHVELRAFDGGVAGFCDPGFAVGDGYVVESC